MAHRRDALAQPGQLTAIQAKTFIVLKHTPAFATYDLRTFLVT